MEMTLSERFIQFLVEVISNFTLWRLIKGLFVLGLGLYLAFALIVLRQVGLMSRTLNGEFARLLKLIAWIHLLAAIGVFLIALAIL